MYQIYDSGIGSPDGNPLARYFESITPEHFRVSQRNVRSGFDLLACCSKS